MTYNFKEYFNKKLKNTFHESGIHMQHFVPYTPQQNGVVEHKNRALKEKATCMMEAKYFSHKLLHEDINCISYVWEIVHTKNWNRKLHLRLGVVINPMFLISEFLAQRLGL